MGLLNSVEGLSLRHSMKRTGIFIQRRPSCNPSRTYHAIQEASDGTASIRPYRFSLQEVVPLIGRSSCPDSTRVRPTFQHRPLHTSTELGQRSSENGGFSVRPAIGMK